MKKNKMSVLTFSCGWRYYLKRPWKFFKEGYWNIRNFIHRGRFGFGYCDVWCMDEYLLDVIPLMLRYLAEHSCGYPGTEPYETPEKYKAFLFQLAEKFEDCQEQAIDKENKYSGEFDRILEETDGRMDKTEEGKEIRKKYFDEMLRLYQERDENLQTAYKELAENHNILWD